MLKTNTQSRLYCSHYVPSDIDCPDCHAIEKIYNNRPLYASLYVSPQNLSTTLDNSKLKLANTFYIPLNENSNTQKSKTNSSTNLILDDFVEMNTKNGIVRIPQSNLIQQSSMKHNDELSTRNATCNAQQKFPADFQKHAHRFTRSFSWKTKPEESPFAQMQPLPKLIKRPGYIEMCFKNICWPTHQLCLCCTRNIAETCRKWSKATGEYDYIDACWSSCALCSDDAYKILNTPVVYNEKIIDPEFLLPLDAELLYYSIQSTKRQQAKQSQQPSPPPPPPPQETSRESVDNQKQTVSTENPIPFNNIKKTTEVSPLTSFTEGTNIKTIISNTSPKEQPSVPPLLAIAKTLEKSKQISKIKPLKSKKSSQSIRRKNAKKKSTRSRSISNKKQSNRSRSTSNKRKSSRTKSRSNLKSRL